MPQGSNKRKALLIGLNYKGTPNELNGCENDIQSMKERFSRVWNVPEDNIAMKMDGDLTHEQGLIYHLNELVKDAVSGDSLLFHYSGHGLQIPDDNGDEADGLDEAIMTNVGLVRDDEIADVLKTIPEGVKIFMIFDCCHSATMADLCFHYSNGREYRYANYDRFKCDVVTISGCQDTQTSADAWISEKRDFFGALTASLLPIFDKANKNTTWKQVIDAAVWDVRKAGYAQIPQFCSTKQSLLRTKVLS